MLALLTVAAAVLRLLHLGTKSLWLDEPLTVALARMSWPRFGHIWWYGEAAYQGAYFLLMRGWLHLGHSEGWIRLPSALFGIASIPLLYVVARELIGEKAALAAAVLLACSPTDVYYSQEARGYTMTILLVLASTWFFVRAVTRERERDWLGWVLFSALAFYSHFFACFVLVAQVLSLFLLKERRPWRRMIFHALLLGALCAPGGSFVLRGPVPAPSLPGWATATPKQLLHLALFLGGSGEKIIFFAILWSAAARAIWKDRLRKEEREIFWRGGLLILWAAVPVAILAAVSVVTPLFEQRYMIFSLPATIMLAGRGMIALPKRRLGVWLVAALCLSSIVNIFMGYGKPREDWRSVTAAVLGSAEGGDAVVIYPSYARTGFDYYYELGEKNAPTVRVFARYYDEGEEDLAVDRALSKDPRAFPHVWVLLRDQSPGKRSLPDYSPQLESRLQSVFGEPRTSRYQGLTVLEFGP